MTVYIYFVCQNPFKGAASTFLSLSLCDMFVLRSPSRHLTLKYI